MIAPSPIREPIARTQAQIDQEWREWGLKLAVQSYRGDDPRALIEMARGIIRYATKGEEPAP